MEDLFLLPKTIWFMDKERLVFFFDRLSNSRHNSPTFSDSLANEIKRDAFACHGISIVLGKNMHI